MAGKMSVPGLILSFYPYLRSAMVRFPFSKNWPLGQFFCRVAMSVAIYVSCPLPVKFISRHLIGSQITWSVPGLSLSNPLSSPPPFGGGGMGQEVPLGSLPPVCGIFFLLYQGLFCHDQVSSGKFLAFFNLWRNLQMFLDAMESRTENKNLSLEKNGFDKVGSDMWNNCLNCP